MEYINDRKQFRTIISQLNLELNGHQEDKIVKEIYDHIDYTRKKAYGSGYDQGKFDADIEATYSQEFTQGYTPLNNEDTTILKIPNDDGTIFTSLGIKSKE